MKPPTLYRVVREAGFTWPDVDTVWRHPQPGPSLQFVRRLQSTVTSSQQSPPVNSRLQLVRRFQSTVTSSWSVASSQQSPPRDCFVCWWKRWSCHRNTAENTNGLRLEWLPLLYLVDIVLSGCNCFSHQQCNQFYLLKREQHRLQLYLFYSIA